MPGPAGSGGSGNGQGNWPTLVKQAEQRAKELEELARSVGPDYHPSRDLLESVGKVELCMRNLMVLIDELHPYVGEDRSARSGQADPLDVLRGSVRKAQVALARFKAALTQELRQQADEEGRHRYRSNKRYGKDQDELLRRSTKVQDRLAELRRHVKGLLKLLSGS